MRAYRARGGESGNVRDRERNVRDRERNVRDRERNTVYTYVSNIVAYPGHIGRTWLESEAKYNWDY